MEPRRGVSCALRSRMARRGRCRVRPAKAPGAWGRGDRSHRLASAQANILSCSPHAPSVKLVSRNMQHAIDLVPKMLEHERQTSHFVRLNQFAGIHHLGTASQALTCGLVNMNRLAGRRKRLHFLHRLASLHGLSAPFFRPTGRPFATECYELGQGQRSGARSISKYASESSIFWERRLINYAHGHAHA